MTVTGRARRTRRARRPRRPMMSPVLADGCPHEQWCWRCFRWEGHGPAGGHCDGLGLWTQTSSLDSSSESLSLSLPDSSCFWQCHVTVTLRVRGLGLRSRTGMDSERAPRCTSSSARRQQPRRHPQPCQCDPGRPTVGSAT